MIPSQEIKLKAVGLNLLKIMVREMRPDSGPEDRFPVQWTTNWARFWARQRYRKYEHFQTLASLVNDIDEECIREKATVR